MRPAAFRGTATSSFAWLCPQRSPPRSDQLRATLTTPYEATQRDVALTVDSAASVRVTVPTPPFYGVVVVKADRSSV